MMSNDLQILSTTELIIELISVKQPIIAELIIEPHCEMANQSKAQRYYSWPFQIR